MRIAVRANLLASREGSENIRGEHHAHFVGADASPPVDKGLAGYGPTSPDFSSPRTWISRIWVGDRRIVYFSDSGMKNPG